MITHASKKINGLVFGFQYDMKAQTLGINVFSVFGEKRPSEIEINILRDSEEIDSDISNMQILFLCLKKIKADSSYFDNNQAKELLKPRVVSKTDINATEINRVISDWENSIIEFVDNSYEIQNEIETVIKSL